MNKVYNVTITRTTQIQVFGDSFEDATQVVSEMYENGDSCCELNDPVYSAKIGVCVYNED